MHAAKIATLILHTKEIRVPAIQDYQEIILS